MSSRRAKSEPTVLHVTPRGAVEAIVPYLPGCWSVVDAGAGSGAITSVLAEHAPERWRKVIACEVVPERVAALDDEHGGDSCVEIADTSFALLTLENVDLVVSNPPFELAEAWLRRAWSPHRTVAFLVRVGWLRSHAHLFAGIGCGDPDVYLLDPRPSFTGGGTDSAEYCWCVWGPGRGGRWMTLHWRAVRGRA